MGKLLRFFKSISIIKTLITWAAIICCSYTPTQVWATIPKGLNQLPASAIRDRNTLTREAQFIYGINAPIPMLAAQIYQESGWRSNITAYDGGMGYAQFMSGTVSQIVHMYPELGPSNPYDPTWAFRAQTRFDKYLYMHVKGKDDCEKFGAALKGYNAGLGYVQRAQKKSLDPNVWFTNTEYIEVGQTKKNFDYSRYYSRVILFKHQLRFASWGTVVCLPYTPVDKDPLK